jgi:hypothetical protein
VKIILGQARRGELFMTAAVGYVKVLHDRIEAMRALPDKPRKTSSIG